MKHWHPSLYSHWYAVARADRLGRKPLAITVLDLPIALARGEDGSLIALEDRCPHRHAPLSSGCVSAAGIACPYHGWRFGADGALLAIPGLPPEQALPGVRVRAFRAIEHDGLIWLRPGEGGQDRPSHLVAALSTPTRRFLWQTAWQAHVVDAMENFMDPMHTHAIHPDLVRKGEARRPARVSLRETDEGFVVDYGGQAEQSGLLYRLFESPRTLERMHFAAPGSAQIEYGYRNGSRVRISLHFTPRTKEWTEVFATLHVEKRWAPAWAVRLLVWPFLRQVGEQDRRILQLQSENLRRFQAPRGASTALDIVRPALERFWSGGGLPDASLRRDVDMLL